MRVLLPLNVAIGLLLTFNADCLKDKTGHLNEPYLEWEIKWDGAEGNPYDVIAHAVFTHTKSGEQETSLMFFDGDNTWKFRFTGTKTGEWKLTTSGPGELDSQTATVTIQKNPEKRNGFFTTKGPKWIWAGSGNAIVPQFVMMRPPKGYWADGRVVTQAIAETVQEFIHEHGFTGFHFSGIAGAWFDIELSDTKDSDDKPIGPQNPDPRTFRVFEEFLIRSYQAGAATHIWMWGADSHADSGPEGIGGPMSKTDQRILRYIAARLGPIPGWSMGYGYDLHAWADEDELQNWYDFLKEQLGGWPHPLGARADRYDANNAQLLKSGEEKLTRRPYTEVFWSGDYVGHYDYRVAYAWFSKLSGYLGKPQFEEDRFRIRSHRVFQHKDYTSDMTLRSMWHSTMAGGVANIWGNLLPHSDNNKGSQPYDNRAKGEIHGAKFTVDIKDQIKTYHKFWFEHNRFSFDLVRDNELTGNEVGPVFLDPNGGGYISVCLRDRDNENYIFYVENDDHVRMDLRGMQGKQHAIAVDTRKSYAEQKLNSLEPKLYASFELPYRSTWAIAVGEEVTP